MRDLDELRAKIKEHQLDRLEEALVALARPGIQMHLSPSTEQDAPVALGASKIGGDPDVPADFVWPAYEDMPLTFIGQFRFSDFAHLDTEGLLPRQGLLSFFYEADSIPYGNYDSRDGWQVFYIADETHPLVRTPHPTTEGNYGLIQALKEHHIRYEAALHIPGDSPAFRELMFLGEKGRYHLPLEQESYYNLMSTLYAEPNHHFLGYPKLVQGEVEWECALYSQNITLPRSGPERDDILKTIDAQMRDWQFLFQIDTDDSLDVMWGDVGTLYVCIPKASLAARRFEDCWTIMQCY